MLEQATTTFNQNKFLQNLAIFTAVLLAIGLFILTITSLGFFRFGPQSKFSQSSGSVLLQTEDFKFAQENLHLSAGTEVKLALFNADVLAHSFDVDELDLHLDMPANETAEATLTIAEPGTYTFYCAIPGHREAGMTGTLIIEP